MKKTIVAVATLVLLNTTGNAVAQTTDNSMSSVAPDYYMQEVESNNSPTTANRITSDGRFGTLSATNDFDFYYIDNITSSGTRTIKLSGIPTGCDYNMTVTLPDGKETSSINPGTSNETITFSVTAGAKYYVEVWSASGYDTARSYLIQAF